MPSGRRRSAAKVVIEHFLASWLAGGHPFGYLCGLTHFPFSCYEKNISLPGHYGRAERLQKERRVARNR